MARNMTRTNSAKKWTIIALIIFLLIALIGATYSRYTSTGSGTGSVQVAKWAVKINTVDIVNQNSFDITFNEVENDNVVDGKIAPSSSLYADFTIDPTGSEVAVDYLFTLGDITSSSGTVPTGIAVEKVVYVKDDGTDGAEITANADKEYVGETIELESQSSALTAASTKKVRVYIKWTNSDEETPSANHTAAGNAAPTLTMQVTGTAKQHI